MDIPALMIQFNDWWKTGHVRNEHRKEKRRTLFTEIEKYLPDRQIIGITGLRRTGKTTLMYQLIDHLINSGVDPKNILYFSFDESIAAQPDVMEQLLENYKKLILKNDAERSYIFIDEVQYVAKWEAVVKRYYDLYPEMKFFVSGSASLQIKKAKESLVGRLYEFVLNPLNFRDFLLMKDMQLPEVVTDFDFKLFEQRYSDLFIQKDEIESLLHEYMMKGGFPEILEEESIEKIHRYLRTNTDKIIFQDITNLFDIREPALLMEILKIIASQCANVIDYQSFAGSLNVSRQTVSNYILYLQESFLLRKMSNYTGSHLSSARKAKKFYLQDHALVNGLLGFTDMVFPADYAGRIIENICVNHLASEHFWRKNYEVDIILNDGEVVPVEIKYRNDPTDIKGLEKFMSKFEIETGVVITKDVLKLKAEVGDILFIPAWLFLSVFKRSDWR
ncbi:MAG TPA: ATP-binding protein [Methanosarcinaceae archaeon]|nr:ATP-binding protein [Methanosarcinaceae archaeon]